MMHACAVRTEDWTRLVESNITFACNTNTINLEIKMSTTKEEEKKKKEEEKKELEEEKALKLAAKSYTDIQRMKLEK